MIIKIPNTYLYKAILEKLYMEYGLSYLEYIEYRDEALTSTPMYIKYTRSNSNGARITEYFSNEHIESDDNTNEEFISYIDFFNSEFVV